MVLPVGLASSALRSGLRFVGVSGVLVGLVTAGACSDEGAAADPPASDAGATDASDPDTSRPTPVPQPGPDASKPTVAAGFAARKVFLGDTDRAGVTSSEAWKSYGRNIDGLTTVGTALTTECKRAAGAPAAAQGDGDGGIDNAWGRTIVPFFSALSPNQTASANQLLEAGARTLMLSFAEPPKASATGISFGLVTAEDTIAAKWDGADSRPIAESSTTGGKPKTVFASATITGGVLASGTTAAPYVLSFSFGGAGLDLPIRVPQVSMTIASDGKTATHGTLSGVIATEELVAAITKAVGGISPALCSGATLDSIKQTIRNASDILVDGTQDPAKDCDAISIGIGFEAVAVVVGPVAGPVAPPKDPCAP